MWGRSEKRGGSGAEKVRGVGGFAGACVCVNDTVLSAQRLQPRLSEQQCRHVEHDSQLAGAWRGSALLRRFLRFIELLYTEEKEERDTS